MSFDLSKLSVQELERLLEAVRAELRRRREPGSYISAITGDKKYAREDWLEKTKKLPRKL